MKPASDVLIDEHGPLSFLSPIHAMLHLGNAEQDKFISVILDSFSTLFQKKFFYLKNEFIFRAFEYDENSIVIEWVFHEAIFSLNIEEKTKNSTWSLIFLGKSSTKHNDQNGDLKKAEEIPAAIAETFRLLADRFTYV